MAISHRHAAVSPLAVCSGSESLLVDRCPHRPKGETTSYLFLKTYDTDGAAWISINRPPLNVLDIPTMELGDALARVERRYLHDLTAAEAAREGLAAFLEKHPPVWRGC